MVARVVTLISIGSWRGFAADDGWSAKKTKEDGRVVQELKVEAPTMTEEDQYGYNMPSKYRCDSCKAVLYHINEAFDKKHPKSRRMKEWEYDELFTETCAGAFDGYGIKLVNGENALSGPGLKQPDSLSPGGAMIQMGGDSWKKRLGEICRMLVYEKMGEDELYDKYYKEKKITESLCYKELAQCETGPPKPPKPKTTTTTTPKTKKEKKKEPKTEKKKEEKKVEKKKKTQTVEVNADGDAKPSSSSDVDKLDVHSFFRAQALQDGLTSDEYLRSRSKSEWEKLIVAMAGRIFNRQTGAS